MALAGSIDLSRSQEASATSVVVDPATTAGRELEDSAILQGSTAASNELETTTTSSVNPDGARSRLRSYDSFLEPTVPPANDDQESIAALLSALKERPTRRRLKPLLYVGLLSAGFSAILLALEGGRLVQAGLTRLELALMGGGICGAVVYAAFLAMALRRSAESQLTHRCLIKVVADLADPHAVVSSSVDAASERARGEIAYLNALLDNTFARAGHLEETLRSEYAQFEKVYCENEQRLQAFVEGLSTERAAIVTNAEKVRSAIAGAHKNLSRDLDAAGGRLAGLIADSSSAFANMLTNKSLEVADAARISSNDCVSRLSAVLDSSSLQMSDKVEASCHKLAVLLAEKGDDLDVKLTGQIKGSSDLLERQLRDMQVKASHRVNDIADQLNKLLERLDKGIGERGDKISSMLAIRTIEISRTLKEGEAGFRETLDRTAALSEGFAKSAVAVGEQMSAHAVRLNDGVVAPLKLVASALDEKGRALSQELVKRFTDIDEMLTANATRLTSTLDRESLAIKSVMVEAVNDLKSVFDGSREFEAVARTQAKGLEAFLTDRLSQFLVSLDQSRLNLVSDLTSHTRSLNALIGQQSNKLKLAAEVNTSGATATIRDIPQSLMVDTSAAVKQTPDAPQDEVRKELRYTKTPRQNMSPAANEISVANEGEKPDPKQQLKQPFGRPARRDVSRGKAETAANETWLTELLARASVEETDQPAAGLTEPAEGPQLSFVAAEIEGFVKTDAFKSAWKKYRLGEGGSCFQRIYTAPGAEMQMKIRQQLAHDTDLQQAVYDFMSEFEKLLREIEADVDDDVFMEYICSNAGKIYTLLVHAAGRFD